MILGRWHYIVTHKPNTPSTLTSYPTLANIQADCIENTLSELLSALANRRNPGLTGTAQGGFYCFDIGPDQQLPAQADQGPPDQPRLFEHQRHYLTLRQFLVRQPHLFQAGAAPGEELADACASGQFPDFRFAEGLLKEVPLLYLHAML